ncbi:MAG: hypothetical protein LBE67_15330 [Kocuria palustris]|nr:hypothetical protein [Kocuria palustris]
MLEGDIRPSFQPEGIGGASADRGAPSGLGSAQGRRAPTSVGARLVKEHHARRPHRILVAH